MFILRHDGRPAARVNHQRVSLADWVLTLDTRDPVRRWVLCRSYFALELQAGRITGAFSEARADHFARCALIPDEEFTPLDSADDAVIAEYFGVPVAQVAEKRLDMEVHVAARG